MSNKKAMGRPTKINIRVINRLADAIQHNYPISDACQHARISRDTYYRHLKSDPIFAKIMTTAHDNKDKVVMSFLTTW